MSGLNKIVGHIAQEAEEKVKAAIKEAEENAASFTAENEKKIEAECDRIARKAESEAENISERSVASAQLRARQILLSGRQEIISDTIKAAAEYLNGLSSEEYFPLLVKLFGKHLPDRDAVISFGRKDLSVITEQFKEQLTSMAAGNGCNLKFSSEPADIENGFVLDFGGIEENCSFGALIENSIEELRDIIQKVLFA